MIRKLVWAASVLTALLVAGCATDGSRPGARSESRRLVQIEFQIIEIDNGAIRTVGNEQVLTPSNICALITGKKARQTGTLVISTTDDQEATVKGTTEFIYPTEYALQDRSEDKANEKKVTVTVSGGSLFTTPLLMPAGFETREVGVVFAVKPTITGEGDIQLLMSPDCVAEPLWQTYGALESSAAGKPTNVTFRMPLFDRFTLTTSVTLHNGEAMVLGACPKRNAHNKTTAVLVCARILK